MRIKECKYFSDGILYTTDKMIYEDDILTEEIFTHYFIDSGKFEIHYDNRVNDKYYIYEDKFGKRTKLKEVND